MNKNIMNERSRKYLLLIVVLVYIVTIGLYYLLSVNLGDTPFYLQMRRFIPASMAVAIPFIFVKEITLFALAQCIITSILCAITSPVFVYFSYSESVTYLSLPYDFSFGLYLFPTIVLFAVILNKILKLSKTLCSKIVTILCVVLTLPPIFQIFYYIKFNHCLTEKGTMAIYQTDFNEALEYISSLGILGVFSIVSIIVVVWSYYSFSKTLFSKLEVVNMSKLQGIFIICLFVPLTYYIIGNLSYKTYFYDLVRSTHGWFQSIKTYRTGRADILENLVVKMNQEQSAPHSIIVVLGESAGRDFMSAFTPMHEITTPWLQEKANSSNFLLFKNTYACDYSTVPVLSRTLTESNYYSNQNFNNSLSFVDIAKEAGYDTYWFSNQGVVGVADTPITLVAETAKYKKWICQDDTDTQYDNELLKYLKMVDAAKNNLIVVHLAGSHIDYNNRYPKSFQKWTDPGETGRLADYKNSLYYTDYVLKNIFEYANDNLNLDVMLYVSDHGTDPNRSRNPDATKFVCLRVPMFIYYSNSYQEQHIDIVNNLNNNQNAFFSNDLVYDLICGLLDVQSNHYEPQNSLTSSEYIHNKESLIVGSGKRSVLEDPHFQ